MPERELHIIRKQVFELQLPDQKEALSRQQLVSRLYREKVLPQLAEEFDALGLGKDTLLIPKLEIDLGEIAPDHLESKFVAQCVQHIHKAVLKKLGEVKAGLDTESTDFVTEPASALASLVHFLETGRIKPILRQYSWRDLEKYWLEKVVASQAEDLKKELAKIISVRDYPIFRLVQQFSPGFLNQVILTWAKKLEKSPKDLPSLLKSLAEAIQKGKLRTSQGENWYISLIQILLGPAGMSQKSRELAQLVQGFKRSKDPEVPARKLKDGEIIIKEDHVENTPESMEEALDDSGDWVSLSGLVLLHPFLPSIFQYLNLLKNDQFSNRKKQERAIFLLYFLATGLEEVNEHELLLPKILCGWPGNMPVPGTFQLSEIEKTEAEELLQATLRHWPALKSTSIDGFRQAFLQRPGLVRFEENGQRWTLQVERKGQDILLDKLPWSISLIQLPWLEAKIWVDW